MSVSSTITPPSRRVGIRRSYRELHVRLEPQELDLVEDVANELGVPVAPTIRLLVGLGIESRRASVTKPEPQERQPTTEMLLHLLVAMEQVLALIESFLPEGPGAADAALPAAALSAHRRLAAGDPERSEETDA